MNEDEILEKLRNGIVEGISEEALDFIQKAIDANIDVSRELFSGTPLDVEKKK